MLISIYQIISFYVIQNKFLPVAPRERENIVPLCDLLTQYFKSNSNKRPISGGPRNIITISLADDDKQLICTRQNRCTTIANITTIADITFAAFLYTSRLDDTGPPKGYKTPIQSQTSDWLSQEYTQEENKSKNLSL